MQLVPVFNYAARDQYHVQFMPCHMCCCTCFLPCRMYPSTPSTNQSLLGIGCCSCFVGHCIARSRSGLCMQQSSFVALSGTLSSNPGGSSWLPGTCCCMCG